MTLTEREINPWIVMAAFLALVGPFALSFHMHYPDEMYYSDAALKMLQNGDYLTTYLGSGELRFKKPILSYWAVLAGYKIFGITPLASRFFFWIAGAATVGLTYAAAKVALANTKTAGLAALIVASHPILIFSATRSIPDVLLTLTMTLAGLGFAGYLRFGNATPKKYAWFLYLGLALAFEAKGLPAFALGGLGIAYLLFNPWNRIPLKTLLHWPSILVSIIIACFWFVAMYFIHGGAYIDSFLYDQVGTRVGSRIGLILSNGAIALALMIVGFFPWFAFGFSRLKKVFSELTSEEKAFLGFVVVWIIAILGMSALTSKFYERYLLPVIPLAGIGLAWILAKNGFYVRVKSIRWTIGFFLVLNILVILFGIYLNLQLSGPWLIWTQVVIALLVLGYLIRLFVKAIKLPKALSYSFLLLFFSISIGTFQISLPDQGQQVKNFAHAASLTPDGKIGFIGNLHVSSKIRIGLGKDYDFVDLPRFEFRSALPEYDRLILEDKYLDSIDVSGYHQTLVSTNWDSRHIPDLLLSVGTPAFDSLLREHGKKYYLLEKVK